jgi:hypothetical protein
MTEDADCHLDASFLGKLDNLCGRMKAKGYGTKIVSGKRTLDEQFNLYADGRTFDQFKTGINGEVTKGNVTQAQADVWIDYYDPAKGKHPMPTDHTSPVTWTMASVHLQGKAADVIDPAKGWPAATDSYWSDLNACAVAEGLQIGPPSSDLDHVQEP